MKSAISTTSDRLEAFSDGVIAVIITIMVLELKAPPGADLQALHNVLPTFGAYVISFIFVGIYWNNHHHMLRATAGIDGRSMWANLHLLFWLSLVPFTTTWLGQNPTAALPTAMYGLLLLLNAIAYTILQNSLVAVNGAHTAFARAVAIDLKGKLSLALYLSSIGLAFISTYLSDAMFIAVAALWIFPDRRFEPVLAHEIEIGEHDA